MKAIIYTTSTCAYCGGVKKWLKAKGVEFEERNAEEPEVLKEMLALRGLASVPQTVIGDKVIIGPDFGGLAKALNEAKTLQ